MLITRAFDGNKMFRRGAQSNIQKCEARARNSNIHNIVYVEFSGKNDEGVVTAMDE